MAYNAALGYDPELDLATEIMKLMSEPVTPENLTKMRELYGQRYYKIKSNPEELGQYDNDDIMRQAKMYMDMAPLQSEGPDLESIYGNRINAATDNLELAKQNNQAAYAQGVSQLDDEYNDIRRQIDLAYRINALGNAEVLAAQGLGRGYSQMPSSGYGETSAISQYTNYANNIADAYNEQQRAKNELYYNMINNNNQAQMQHNNQLDSIWASKGQDMYNSYYDNQRYMLDAQGLNSAVNKDYYTNNLAEREFANDRDLAWANLGETSRANKANEAIDRANYNEAIRSNKANEGLQSKKLDNDFYIDQKNYDLNRRRYGL